MFKLQRLEITGFKSFADYTEIIFTGDGITAVVGPNGCGKSNISDAITWVLGEQRAKSLRGGEMQDVIFAGAKVRPPSGMAEVVLHLVRVETGVVIDDLDEIDEIDDALNEFDEVNSQQLTVNGYAENGSLKSSNGNGYHSENGAEIAVATNHSPQSKRKWKARRPAALEFVPGEAVSVTRRLYRSGDSDYLLNGRACRLRDIQDLFAGTGLSGGHYALIQQEKISQILSAKPADRRQLIEEAAGVTKFRTRQRAAETRLESAKANLRRISDIVSEIDKQAGSLRRQAARTRRYKELQQIWRELSAQVLSAEARGLSEMLDELREKLSAAAQDESRLSEAVKERAVAAQNATATARGREDELTIVRQTAADNALRRERLKRDFAHQTEQSADLAERSNALQTEIKTLNERLKAVSEDEKRLREKNRQSGVAGENETASLVAAEEEYQKHLLAVRQIEAEVEKIRQQIFLHTTASERFREIARQQTSALEKIAERAAALDKEGWRAEQTHLDRINELTALNSQLEAARQIASELQNSRQIAAQTVAAEREKLRQRESVWSKARDESESVNARLDALGRLDANNALLAPAVQKLFAASDKIGVKPRGTLADFLEVDSKYEKAVEAACGGYLQTVLVENRADVEKIARWLAASKAGIINLLVMNPSEKKSEKGAEKSDEGRRIKDALGIADDLKALLQTVWPTVLNCRIIERLDEAAGLSEENCVTLAGELVSQNQFFAFGPSQSGEKGNILSFKRELRELRARAEILAGEVASADGEVKTARQSLAAAEQAVSVIQTEIAASERDLMSAEVNAKSLAQEIERAERHRRVVADERQRLENERLDLAAKQLKTGADKQLAEQELEKANSALGDISATLANARNRGESSNRILSERRAEAAAANERRRSLQNALRRVEQERAEIETRRDARNRDLSVTATRLAQLQISLDELTTQTAQIDREQEREAEIIAAATLELTAARKLADQSAWELSETNAVAARAAAARATFEIAQAETMVKLENLTELCQHELSQALTDLPTAEPDFDLTAGRRQIEDLREKLASFGAVNLLALDELSEAEERLLFLSNQRRDIVDGIVAAEEALGEIKRRSRERFENAFNEINRNFTELFAEIFGGGRGEMSLMDAADVLESGVEIVAQPPGKRLQNLLLLSGGEKALTAIALVLAIFRFRPAPFCLLDEVDAPLDEANVGRFVEKVREMSESIQFIVITHNKRTMEAARALYGVTMEEAGISKIVSVKFE